MIGVVVTPVMFAVCSSLFVSSFRFRFTICAITVVAVIITTGETYVGVVCVAVYCGVGRMMVLRHPFPGSLLDFTGAII